MYKLCVLVALALVGIVSAEIIENVPCTGRRESNIQSTVHEISVTPCESANGLSSSPCRLTRGTNSTAILTVKFTPQLKHKRMKATLAWRNGNIDLPFRGMQSNACRSLAEGRCPTTPGQQMTWTALVPLSSSFPANNYPLKLKIMDGSKFVVCNHFSIKLQ